MAQKVAFGRTSPAAFAFSGFFITASGAYSLPGPWQLSQSSGGVRLAWALSVQEANCSLWQTPHFRALTRVSPGLVAATAIGPPGSTTAGALTSGVGGVAGELRGDGRTGDGGAGEGEGTAGA